MVRRRHADGSWYCSAFLPRDRDARGPRTSDMKLDSRTSSLQELYAEESARIQKRFDETGDGKAAIRDRTALIDSVVTELWTEVTATGGPIEGFCIAAMGGYGRRGIISVFGHRSSVPVRQGRQRGISQQESHRSAQPIPVGSASARKPHHAHDRRMRQALPQQH